VPLVGADQGDIGLLDAGGQWLEYVASYGPRAGHVGSIPPLRRGRGIDGYVVERGEAVVCADLAEDPRTEHRDVMAEHGFRAYLCVPLRSGGEVIGTLGVLAHRPGAFGPDQRRQLESLGLLAGAAIREARL